MPYFLYRYGYSLCSPKQGTHLCTSAYTGVHKSIPCHRMQELFKAGRAIFGDGFCRIKMFSAQMRGKTER